LRRVVVALAGCLALLAAPHGTAAAGLDAALPVTTWTSWLPSMVHEYDPASADDCTSGRDQCAVKTTRVMSSLLESLAGSCSHNAVFALAYLRISQGYAWIRNTRNSDDSPYFADTRGLNFVVEVFAQAYLHAYDEWAAGRPTPRAWQIALDAAQRKQVTGTGDLLLGINAHINRDLPFVLAASGLVSEGGTSRKPDYDKVNDLLYLLNAPINAEEAARFDPAMNTGTGSLLDPATFQAIELWRERAWRNAEALVSAQTAAQRAAVAKEIEDSATAQAELIRSTNSYLPPLTTTTKRDSYCSAHAGDAAPLAYPFA